MKRVSIGDFLTDEEIKRAIELWNTLDRFTVSYAQTLTDEIIAPNIERINAALGQENDPKYLAYVVEYAMIMGGTDATS